MIRTRPTPETRPAAGVRRTKSDSILDSFIAPGETSAVGWKMNWRTQLYRTAAQGEPMLPADFVVR